MKFVSLWPAAARQPGPSDVLSLPIGPGRADAGLDAEQIAHEVTALFDELRNPTLRYLLSMGLPAADGEEVLQEVFLALFEHLRRDRPRTNLRGWIFRTAHNLGLKRRKRIRRSAAGSITDETLAQPADLRPNPEERLRAQQRYRRMQAVLEALPDRDRSCLNLRAEGLTYREIAEALDMSLGAVSISIQRSLERLRRADR